MYLLDRPIQCIYQKSDEFRDIFNDDRVHAHFAEPLEIEPG
jgi:hypothetical protein